MTQTTELSTCAVTGANGYVGRIIVQHLRDAGKRVICLQRTTGDADVRAWSLQGEPSTDMFADVDVLIHCAYVFGSVGSAGIEKVNVHATLRWFDAAKAAGVRRIIFISSVSCYDDCKSLYGKAKLAVERRATEFDMVIVRPGLVYGPTPGGMVGSLTKILNLPGPLLPMVGAGRLATVLVHEHDLGQSMVQLCGFNDVPAGKPISAANDQLMSFVDIMKSLARARGKKVIFVPVPWRLLWLPLRIAESVGVRARLRSDSLVGLVNQNPAPDFSITRQLGLSFRPFSPDALSPNADH